MGFFCEAVLAELVAMVGKKGKTADTAAAAGDPGVKLIGRDGDDSF